MSQQTKRPLSISASTTDQAQARRRELTAIRVRNYRARQRATQSTNAQPTRAQLAQGEQIIDFGPSIELETAQTLLSLGLRINGLTLAQDSTNLSLQQDTTPVNEHEDLYDGPRPPPEQQSSRVPTLTYHSSGQSKLTAFVSIHRQGNPFTRAVPSSHSPISARSSSTRPSFSLLSNLTSSTLTRPSFSPLSTSTSSRTIRPSFSPLSALVTSVHDLSYGSEDLVFADNDPENSDIEDSSDQDNQLLQSFLNPTKHTSLIPLIPTSNDDPSLSYEGETTQQEIGHAHNIPRSQSPYERPRQDSNLLNNDNDDSNALPIDNSDPEYPTPLGDEGDETATAVVEATVDKILNLFGDTPLGCTDAQHDEHYRQHMTNITNHYGLNDVFNDAESISVLGSPDFLTPERLAQLTPPTTHQLQSTFCGISPHQPRPQQVCLHQEETRDQPCRRAFDVDSYLGFLTSLRACRQGLWHQPVPQARQNMTTDIHIQETTYTTNDDPERSPRARLAMLRDIPHFLLGRVAGAHDITVYVLFPHLDRDAERFVSLTKEQLTRWVDLVLYPAIHRHCEAHYTQHLPASFRHAFANSKARQVEGRRVETASYQAQQSLGHHLQPEYLADIWTDVLRTVETLPGVRDFREPQLFFSAKGCKLQFKSNSARPTLFDTMEHFESYLEDTFRPDFVNWRRVYIDLAFEICPEASYLIPHALPEDEEPQVLSWRRCCQEKIIQQLYDDQPPSRNGPGQRYYTQNMLYDIANASSAPPKRSQLYHGGVRYIQLYGSVKEVWDAAQSQPFDNDGLEEMALDPLIRQAARSLAHGRRRDNVVIERAYCTSKVRAHQALRDSRKKSFGIRGEVRTTWDLFQALMDRLRLDPREEAQIRYDRAPSYVWVVKTSNYLNFLWRSADKFASLFEIVRARASRDLVTWEQTKVMAMSLRCLRFVFGAHQLSQESALWWSRRDRLVGDPPQLKTWYGLGFCHTLPRYGYCWLEPRLDWTQLAFQSAVTDNILFGNNMLRGQYLRRGGQVADFFHVTRRLDLALEWLARYHYAAMIQARLIFWIIHLCLQQFRVDTISSMKSDIKPECYQEASRGLRPFCHEYFEEILIQDVYLISGNRCDFKKPSHLSHFLFDFNDGRTRNHWANRPFRNLYQRAHQGLSLLPQGPNLVSTFTRRLWRSLFAYHWVLPYPNVEVLTQTTKQGERMMYSIELDKDIDQRLDLVNAKSWQWARKGWREGFPDDLPPYVLWTREEWDEWIARHDAVDAPVTIV